MSGPTTPVVHLDAETLLPVGISSPCPSSAVAHLGASMPGGSRLMCGLLAGHGGPHVFHMEWTDPTDEAPRRFTVGASAVTSRSITTPPVAAPFARQ